MPSSSPDSYRERAAHISTWVALAFFAVFAPYNLWRGRTVPSIVDGLAAVLLLGHLIVLRRVNRPLVSAVVAAAVLFAMVLPYGLEGYVRGYFWAIAAPPLVFFFAGVRRGAWLTAALFVALVVLLALVPPRKVVPGLEVSIVVAFLTVVLFAVINERQRLRYEAELMRLSGSDPLTDLANRRRYHELLESEHERARRYQRSYAVMVIDVDEFKQVNDRFGHDEGDRVLKAVAGVLVAGVRTTDEVARFGGDEFAVLCPETSLADAAALADRLRAAVLADPTCAAKAVTLSAGVAALRPGDDLSRVLKRADEALYAAKSAGRNRVLAG